MNPVMYKKLKPALIG